MKKFNTTGHCIQSMHYMANTDKKLFKIIELIEAGEYFTINRPRQYGKTTTLYLLKKILIDKGFFPVHISFEGIGSDSYKNEKLFIDALFDTFIHVFEWNQRDDIVEFIEDNMSKILSFKKFGRWISRFIRKIDKSVVMMIDEVDSASNNQLFINFLGLLREKYQAAKSNEDITFHSIILTGVHDVKNLKLKIRDKKNAQYNSPWNIAADFLIDMSLNPDEIAFMLNDYSQEQSITMNEKNIAEKLYYYTSGHPFLVSKLCQIIDRDIVFKQKLNTWQDHYVDDAAQILIALMNTNFESLIKNIENNKDLYSLVKRIIIHGDTIKFVISNNLISMGIMYGILKNENNFCKINNRIYEQVIYNYMTIKLFIDQKLDQLSGYNFQESYIENYNELNLKKILLNFQKFMKSEFSIRDQTFLERNGRLIFLAFIQPILNGRGHDFKEVQISEEKRLDVVIVFENKKYIVELKIWRGQAAHEKGLDQLDKYLEKQFLNNGYLVIFDFTQKGIKEWKNQMIKINKKEIFAIWV